MSYLSPGKFETHSSKGQNSSWFPPKKEYEIKMSTPGIAPELEEHNPESSQPAPVVEEKRESYHTYIK